MKVSKLDRSLGGARVVDDAPPLAATGPTDALASVRAAFAVSSDALVLLDGDGRIALTNRRFEELLQLPAEYLLGKRLTGLHADLARLFAEPDVIAAGMRDASGKARAQWTAAQRWPEERQLQFTFSALPHAGPRAGVLGVQPLSADGAGQRLKDHFLALTAQALRSPLASIIGFVDLLRTDAASNLTEKQQEYLAFVHSDALNERDVIEQLLEVLTIDAGRIVLYRDVIMLEPLLRRAALALQERLAASEQHLLFELPQDLPAVTGDAERLLQAIRAVLTEASARGSEGSDIRLQVTRSAKSVRLAIRDDGLELTDEETAWLRAHLGRATLADAPPEEGIALGLLLAQTIMHLHGGSLDVVSPPEGGAEFVLTLPG